MSSDLEGLEATAREFGMPFMAHMGDQVLDPLLIERLPLDWARSRLMLPVRLNNRISVVISDPARLHEADDLALLLGCEPDLILAPAEEIRKAIEKAYFNRDETSGDFLRALEAHEPSRTVAPVRETDDILRVADSAPVAQLVNLILLDAVKSGASDVHLEPYQDQLRMRFRLDGLLYERNAPPKYLESALVSRLKVMGHLDIAEKRLPQDGTARVRVGEREVDIRISTLPVEEGERVVLRLLNREATLLPLEQLGLSEHARARMRKVLREPNGVIWVTGPTGSGKTTTLYAALRELDTQRLNIMTIEDPVEYQLPTISQMGVKPKIGLTFAKGLRHILRQDPDVILVGETRDMETAEIVVRASLTGHVVFSTLHTNDAAGALVRLVDMGVEPFLVAASTRAALAQRLVRMLCPQCKEPYALTKEDAAHVGLHDDRLVGRTFWRAGGCAHCTDGYRGRLGIFEWLEMNTELQDIVRAGGRLQDVQTAAERAGMITLFQDGLQKAAEGVTSLEEVIRVVGPASAP